MKKKVGSRRNTANKPTKDTRGSSRMLSLAVAKVSKKLQYTMKKIKLQNTGSVGLHIHREWTIPDCPNKLFYTNQGEEEMWAVLGRDGQLMSDRRHSYTLK
jgi:hypothetical protein